METRRTSEPAGARGSTQAGCGALRAAVRVARRRRDVPLALACVAAVTLTLGCAGTPAVRPGPLPAGASFEGVWQSPQYGRMELCRAGQATFGTYAKDDRRGRIFGTVEGDLMRFRWSEERALVPSHPQQASGRGRFRLEVGQDGDQYLVGVWGLDAHESGGGPWNAVKLRHTAPTQCRGPSQAAAPGSWGEEDTD